MKFQKLFRSSFINQILDRINSGNLDEYFKNKFTYSEESILVNPKIIITNKEINLIDPDRNKYDFENAKIIFKLYKEMTPVQATDVRIWTYLAHVTYWDYMKKRWPLEEKKNLDLKNHILSHWFINNLNSKSISRHGIALLWWGAYLTYDETKSDPFLLTKEFFSYLEYTRGLFEVGLGKSKIFTHSFLEFVIQNYDVFKENKENRIRALIIKINCLANYRNLTSLSKEEIKKILSQYKEELKQVYGRQNA